MGGLYLLEQFALDSERHRGVAFEIIGAFVRDKTPILPTCSEAVRDAYSSVAPRASVEVQAALTIIGRRPEQLRSFEIDLARTCLAGVDARNATLFGVNLEGADLTRVRLNEADLRDANLTDADLRFADIGVVGFGVDGMSYGFSFDGVTPKAEFGPVRYRPANLGRAVLNGADLTSAALEGADLSDAQLRGATLTGARAIAARLPRADLFVGKLVGVMLAGADLTGASLVFAELQDADLRFANLRNAFLIRANLTNADLSGADLRGADLTAAVLVDAYFGGDRQICDSVDPSATEGDRDREIDSEPWAVYDSTTKWPEGFTPSWPSQPS